MVRNEPRTCGPASASRDANLLVPVVRRNLPHWFAYAPERTAPLPPIARLAAPGLDFVLQQAPRGNRTRDIPLAGPIHGATAPHRRAGCAADGGCIGRNPNARMCQRFNDRARTMVDLAAGSGRQCAPPTDALTGELTGLLAGAKTAPGCVDGQPDNCNGDTRRSSVGNSARCQDAMPRSRVRTRADTSSIARLMSKRGCPHTSNRETVA